MTKSTSSISSVDVPSIFVIRLMNVAQFLNATTAGLLCAVVTILLLAEI